MAYPFPPDLSRKVQERLSAGGYSSEDELLLDAMLALEDMEQRAEILRTEYDRRLLQSGTSLSTPLDREAFKEEARARYAIKNKAE